MEFVGSAAAVLQLLGQAISLVQEAYQVRQAIRTAPKTLEDTKTQLSMLVDTVVEVKQSPELHTPAIDSQLRQINYVIEDLVKALNSMTALQRRNKVYKTIHFWMKRQNDETKLEAVLVRLDRAKNELAIRIQVAHTDVSRRTALGVQRIEQEVRAGIGMKTHQFRLEGNRATENANQINGILGFDNMSPPTMASVRENTSIGSRQTNLILSGPVSLKSLQGLDL